jgi:tetratricopeptide (TPR) repeat protein
MYNLLIALAAGSAAFMGGWLFVNTVVSGIIPGTLVLFITYFMLARRTGRKLQALMEQAMAEFQAQRVEKGRKMIESGFALGRWQFMVSGQLHAQLGAIAYMQRDFKSARTHLSKSWGRNWHAQAMLSCIDHREKKHSDAIERMGKAKGGGKKDPLYWGLYAFLAKEGGDSTRALQVLGEALKKHENSDALKTQDYAYRNKKKFKPKAFAPTWYQFFPEQMPRSMQMAYGQAQQGQRRGGYSFPHPRR